MLQACRALIMVSCIVLVAACAAATSSPEATAPPVPAQPASTATTAVTQPGTTPTKAATSTAQATNAPATPAPTSAAVTPLELGDLRFTVDNARKQSLNLAADGKPATLSTSDAAGYVWTLTLPRDAMLNPRAISMTPFATLSSSGALSPKSGVLLEPNGLTFSAPITLSVKPPTGSNAYGALFIAAHDGTQVQLAQTNSGGSIYAASLWHFSSGAWGDFDDSQAFKDKYLPGARAEYKAAMSVVQELTNARAPLAQPPSVRYACTSNQGEDEAQAFAQSFLQQEREAISRLLRAARALALLGEDKGDEPFAAARNLIATRDFPRVNQLFAQYGDDVDKFYAVSLTAMQVLREYTLLGGAGAPDWFAKIRPWALKVRDTYLDKLRNEHDYSLFPEVLRRLERQALLFGNNDDGDAFVEKMLNAMTFKLFADDTLDYSGSRGVAHFVTHGEIVVRPTSIAPITWRTTGSVNYLDGTDDTARGRGTVILPNTFPVTVDLQNFDACKAMSVDVLMDRLGATTETLRLTGGGVTLIVTTPSQATEIVNGVLRATRFDPSAGMYRFKTSLQNRQETAVNQTISEANEGGNVKLGFQLVHTPK